MSKLLNKKNIIESLKTQTYDEASLEEWWEHIQAMSLMGFIDSKVYDEIFDKCKGWYWNGDSLKDENDCDVGAWVDGEFIRMQ